MIEYQPACRYAVTATMNIARNTSVIPINGIFANKSTRAMRPTSIVRMTDLPVIHLPALWRSPNDTKRASVHAARPSRNTGRTIEPMTTGAHTRVDEIATDIYRLSTWIPDIGADGFTMNQFLLTGDEPFLFHCGQRKLFSFVSEAIGRVMPVEKLRWISFGHLEADECGAMNMFLDASPDAEVIHGALACSLSLIDMC